ncbi:hypothetical protein AVEN_203440-1 [Araneus ventricosus]|uniref:Uncharacterized protein n=1 Tax=Araneus ventricosus TaxID=182803 RepID=A0A4Y2BGD2_ARAVE|nr:hypothetical protein AVEN_203440-1 [Araneus ventricosus]
MEGPRHFSHCIGLFEAPIPPLSGRHRRLTCVFKSDKLRSSNLNRARFSEFFLFRDSFPQQSCRGPTLNFQEIRRKGHAPLFKKLKHLRTLSGALSDL